MVVRGAWERVSVYLPIILMGFIALGTYWLARNTPALGVAQQQPAATMTAPACRYGLLPFGVRFAVMARSRS